MSIEAVGVRIGRGDDPPSVLRQVIPWHLQSGVWRTSRRPKEPWPIGTPVIASVCQRWTFIVGEVSGEFGPSSAKQIRRANAAPRLPLEIPIAWDTTVYVPTEPIDRVLDRLANYRGGWMRMTADDFERARKALVPA